MKLKDVMMIAIGAAIGYLTVQLIQSSIAQAKLAATRYGSVTM